MRKLLTGLLKAVKLAVLDDNDAGAHGIGRLTGYTDPSGSTSLAYDVQGRVVSETRTIAGRPYTTVYAYDAAGRLAPDRRQLRSCASVRTRGGLRSTEEGIATPAR